MSSSGREIDPMRPVLPVLAAILLMAGCAHEPPVGVDGNATIVLYAVWNTSGSETAPSYGPLANAKVVLVSEYGSMVRTTDASGALTLEHMPASTYSISVRRPHPLDANIQLIGSAVGVVVRSGQVAADTILAKAISSTGIAINEIYAAGPVNNMFFFYDQFVELYNASDSVRYLDGMLISRMSGNSEGAGPGADEGSDGDIDGVTYIFRFPGLPGETNHPIHPGQFVVLAVDAVDHRSLFPNSIDLSRADWEFYNQYSPEDVDNASVSNLINLRSDKTVDFLISLTNDVIMLASGRDTVWEDGIDIGTVVDAVEYQSSLPPALLKTLDARIDRGVALSPARYSGQSMQRAEPGMDSNDATLDFVIISLATPGRQ
jgi:hypothetical protein